MSNKYITPQTLKGFRDCLPDQMMAREALIDIARRVYRSYGYSPIDTPALEYTEILLGKGGGETDKQMYRFNDGGERDVSMRFDLTIPFARFAAQHLNEIGTPFKRYHIAPVWRAEKPQKGRFREFIQCDFDTIGTDSNSADIETLMVIHDLFVTIGFERFTIRVNNRLLLSGLLESLDLSDKTAGVLRALDKLPKIGRDAVIKEMDDAGLTSQQAKYVLEITDVKGTPGEQLARIGPLLAKSEQGTLGVARLRQLFDACKTAGIAAERIELDVSIARGLDYYTGTIYETFLGDLPGIGSVCSGGRYDNLAGLFTSQKLPGVGASLGLDRLLAAMTELGMIKSASTPAQVLVTMFDEGKVAEYLRVGRTLRAAGIDTEVFTDTRKLGKQLQYASKKGFRIAVIAGDAEFAAGTWQVKDLQKGEQHSVSEPQLAAAVQAMLGRIG